MLAERELCVDWTEDLVIIYYLIMQNCSVYACAVPLIFLMNECLIEFYNPIMVDTDSNNTLILQYTSQQ